MQIVPMYRTDNAERKVDDRKALNKALLTAVNGFATRYLVFATSRGTNVSVTSDVSYYYSRVLT